MSDPNSNLGRVIANVVDIQQSIIVHCDNLSKAIDGLKLEHQSSIAALREDLRRTDDRSQKQVDEINVAHNKEVERLLNIIQTLLSKEATSVAVPPPAIVAHPTQQQAMLAQQQFYQQQNALQASLMMQNQHHMMQRQMQEEHARIAAQMQAQGSTVGTPILLPQAKPSITTGVVPQVPKINPPVVAQVPPPVVSIPATKEVVLPPVVIKPPVVEEKPKTVVIPPAVTPVASTIKPFAPAATNATPTFSFGGSSNIFGKKPEVPAATTTTPSKSTAGKEDDEEGDVEEYEPEGDFKPVIPLPELVDVKTGEEEESVVFNNRAKLYIYANETSEWKERGTGELKVLLNKESKKYRVVMRRDQVLKVCANFPIIGSMTIQKMASNDKAYTWFCEDFAEDKPEHVKLSARFASVEIALEFKNLFEKAVNEHKSTPQKAKTIDSEIKAAVVKKEEVKEEPKDVVIPSNKENVGFGDKFKPAAGSWECTECYVRNNAGTDICSCCGSGKDGKPADKAATIFSKPSILQQPAGPPKFSFGMSAAAAAKEPLAQSQSPQFGGALNGSANNTAMFGGAGTPKASLFGGGTGSTTSASTTPSFSFGKSTPAEAAPASSTTNSTPKFSFMKAAEQASTNSPSTGGSSLFGNSVKPAEAAKTTPSFSFGKQAEAPKEAVSFSFGKQAEAPKETPKFSFGKQPEPVSFVKASNSAESPSTASATTTSTPKSIFGAFASGESFSSFAAKQNSNIFEGETAKKAQEEFKSQKKSTAPTVNAEENDEENENDDTVANEEEPDVEFTPVIPLPDLIEVKTGEEGEEILFKARSKLYKFYKDLGENKERGVGDCKILYNKDTNTYRFVMRREQVHKICANFRIEQGIQLSSKGGMPNVLTFVCNDFSEDDNGEMSVFILKFKEEKIANEFKKVFTDAQSKIASA
ncbi:unnamed protein product [Caenorhabditis angaria]|uniref:Uncharacterized protein n=1 Tax=Caenorhabditis angaria TaxID=860376 RepID=A0A9P1IJB2_9PELO|nr:unnamed protein product [Caenorhabditis angaria]